MFYIVLVTCIVLFFLLRWFLRADPHLITTFFKKLFCFLGVALLILLTFSGRLGSIGWVIGALLPIILTVIVRLKSHTPPETPPFEEGVFFRDDMSEEEAYKILDLKSGASEAEIHAAYKRLIKKVHPDRGGSTYLTSRLNQAKDFLLRGRR